MRREGSPLPEAELPAVPSRVLVAVALLALAILAAGCGSGAPVVAPGGAGSLTAQSDGEQDWGLQILALTNAERAAHGLEPLLLDEFASNAAYEHAWDMDLRDFFAHVNPDDEDPRDRLLRHGVAYEIAGENLARGQTSPEEVVQAWMDSPSHRENLLYPGWTHIGIGVHTGPVDGPWWVQEFYR